MLGRNVDSLRIPRLNFEKEVTLGKGNTKRSAYLYTLNWTALDRQCSASDKVYEPVPNLPEKYDILVKSFKFALTPKYLAGVQHFANLALQERNRSWGFDTMIRDNIQLVNQSAIETAFMLLADCLYDEETGGWVSHDKWRSFAKPLMIYKFWAFQTGRGLVRGKSGIDGVIDRILEREDYSIFTKAMAKDIASSLDDLEDQWERIFTPQAEECEERVWHATIEPSKHEELNREINKIRDAYKYLVDFFGMEHPDALDLKNKYSFL